MGTIVVKTRFVHKLKKRLNYAYKRAKIFSEKQAQKYKHRYDKKVKGHGLQIDDLVLVKVVAWKGRHKIQDKWEQDEYVVVSQPNPGIPVHKVRPVTGGKEKVLHRNLLLPLGIKLVPDADTDSDSDSDDDHETVESVTEEPVLPSVELVSKDVAPELDVPEVVDVNKNPAVKPEVPVSQNDSSVDRLIDIDVTLNPEYLVHTDDTAGSASTDLTHILSEPTDKTSLLPSTDRDSDSLMETKEFLKFVDELSSETEDKSEDVSEVIQPIVSDDSSVSQIYPRLINLLGLKSPNLKVSSVLVKCSRFYCYFNLEMITKYLVELYNLFSALILPAQGSKRECSVNKI